VHRVSTAQKWLLAPTAATTGSSSTSTTLRCARLQIKPVLLDACTF
jgi:uncharacterized protein (DUF1778 family)